jgi:cytochrome c peroxidase
MIKKTQQTNKSKLYVHLIGLTTISGFMMFSCQSNTAEQTEPVVVESDDKELRDQSKSLFGSISSLPEENIPANKIVLGQKLFYDTKLSKDGTISCNSCHNLKTYGVDNLSFSPGDTKALGGRNSPSAIYAFTHSMQFWDGRAKDVEEQAGGPILNPVEHNIPNEAFLEKRLREDANYQKLFKEVYPNSKEPITFANITNAIGAFERQLKPASRYDLWVDGDDKALTADEKAGLKVFIDKGCITCHSGTAFGGKMFQKFGLFADYWKHTKSKNIDNGLYDISKKESDKFFFKVPSLRNVAMTYPYFHDGSVTNLEDAVKVMSETQLANKLNDSEIKSVVVFLKSLTAEVDKKYQQ